MKNFKYKTQPPGSKLCGQVVLSMITGISIHYICNDLKNRNATRNKELIMYLECNNIKTLYKRCSDFNKVPNKSIVKIKFNNENTHWVFYYNGLFYDPDIGIIKSYNDEWIKCVSYIKLK